MPKKVKELSALEIRRLKRPGLHAAGGVDGLQLQVKQSGARSWILRIKIGDKRPDLGLGGYPDTTLEQARERARDARELIRQGIDPRDERRRARAALAAANAARMTFSKAAKMAHSARSPEFKNKKHTSQWITSLEKYAFPVLGDVEVGAITMQQVLAVLEPIWLTKTETATRVRERIEAVLAWSTVSGYRSGQNPAVWKGNLKHALPAPSKIKNVRNHPAFPWKDISGFMAQLRSRNSTSARALEFAILTAARSQEVRLATWAEIDLDARLWTAPAAHMKAGQTHRVPLSEPAVALLRDLPNRADGGLVFQGHRSDRPLSDSSISKFLRELLASTPWPHAVPHGFRSTFMDWARSCTNFPKEVVELALAHVNSDATRAAYARDELLPRRAKLMQQWGRFCGERPSSAKIVPLKRSND